MGDTLNGITEALCVREKIQWIADAPNHEPGLPPHPVSKHGTETGDHNLTAAGPGWYSSA